MILVLSPGVAGMQIRLVRAVSADIPLESATSPVAKTVQRRGKGSGFWTSDVPAVGGAYRYRHMLIGIGVLMCMLLFTRWIVRRNVRNRC